ncbi:hypothetical protein GCM10027289_12550 [Tsukamurella serpentis]
MTDRPSPLRGLARGESVVALLVDDYLTSIADVVYLPFPAAVCRSALATAFEGVIAALTAEDFSPDAGREFGRVLVSLQITAAEAAAAAARSIAGLADALIPDPSTEVRRRTALILAEFTGGYADASARRIVDGQAGVHRATDAARRTAVEGERQALARLRVMFEHARSALFVADERGTLLEVSPVMAMVIDANRDLVGARADDVRPLLNDDPATVDRVLRELIEADDDTVTRFLEHPRLHAGGGTVGSTVGRWALNRVRSRDDRPALIVGVGHDVTELQELHAQLSHLAHHDALTGLPNRRRLTDDLDAMPPVPFGFCLIDLDGFKHFNDRLGHAAGDQLLVAAAHRMRSILGGTGTLYRVGGDEFAVLVPQPFRPQDAAELLHRALSTPLELPAADGVGPRPLPVRVGASIGTTVATPQQATIETLIAAADAGLYRSKEARRA